MPVVPSLMVLYTNDAVEVRYSDGSRLQLSPCGASMCHQDRPTDETHPLRGVDTVHKWTQFVTSEHKGKVLQALDFRNRFAQRPFLCSTLMQPEDIVSLYASIEKVAWPKLLKGANAEVLEDGSRRVVSTDEFATMVLSPHGQDFTVCYLSHISDDSSKVKGADHSELTHSERSPDRHGKGLAVHFHSDFPDHAQESSLSGEGSGGDGLYSHRQAVTEGVAGSFQKIENEADGAVLTDNVHEEGEDTKVEQGDSGSEPTPEEFARDASGIIVSDGTMSTPSVVHTRGFTNTGDSHQQTPPSKFNISPIQHDISSISRVSTPDGLRGLVECDSTLSQGNDTAQDQPQGVDVRHSSPVSLTNTVQRTNRGEKPDKGEATLTSSPKAVTSPDRKGATTGHGTGSTPQASGDSGSDGHRTDSPYSPKSDKACQTVASRRPTKDHRHKASPKADSPHQILVSPKRPGHQSAKNTSPSGRSSRQQRSLPERQTGGERDRFSQLGVGSGICETWSSVRHHYTWVTQHFSCSDCPAAWRHPLKLLQQCDPTDAILVTECHLSSSTTAVQRLSKATIKPDDCVFSPLAAPLPLTCPFQHLHAWQPHHLGDGGEGQSHISEFKQGQLKVIMMEGVVYRFVQLANVKVVEIYPGDGSVFISQGLTGLYFLHIVWRDGKLEERTYSLKAPPPATSKSLYSVEKLIKRANRFLSGCIENAKLSEREDLPCWKHVQTQVVEPLSTTLLEDCTVPGYGHFIAYTNGRIRIMFEDRTALDMVSDFSGRLQGCLHHSLQEEGVVSKLGSMRVSSLDEQLGTRRCRLLLPTGKYVVVDIDKPGVYRRYIDAANEWINWVRSSPKERQQFYHDRNPGLTAQLSAEAELKKIECFNYIVDHSGITQGLPSASYSASAVAHAAAYPSALGSLHTSPPTALSYGRPIGMQLPQSKSSHGPSSVPAQYSSLYGVDYAPQAVSPMQGSPPGGYRQGQGHALLSDPKGLELMQGFNSVKEALLRTSQMIKDIDEIVKVKKTSENL